MTTTTKSPAAQPAPAVPWQEARDLKLNIHQRLLMIIAAGGIEKSRKSGIAYEFHQIDDVTAHLSPLFVRWGVHALPVAKSFETEVHRLTSEKGERVLGVTDALVGMRFINVDDPDDSVLVEPMLGQGFDYSDKSSGKAISYALKALLLAEFQLRGQPDVEAEDHRRPGLDTAVGGKSHSNEPAKENGSAKISDGQVRRLFALAKEHRGASGDDTVAAVKERYRLASLRDLTRHQLDEFGSLLDEPPASADQLKEIELLAADAEKNGNELGGAYLRKALKIWLTVGEADRIIRKVKGAAS